MLVIELHFVNDRIAEKKNLVLISKKKNLAMYNAVLQSSPSAPPAVPDSVSAEVNEPLVWLLVAVAVAAPAAALLLLGGRWLFARAQMPPVLRQRPRYYSRDSPAPQQQLSSRRGDATTAVKQQKVAAKDVAPVSTVQSPRTPRGYAGQTRREYFSTL